MYFGSARLRSITLNEEFLDSFYERKQNQPKIKPRSVSLTPTIVKHGYENCKLRTVSVWTELSEKLGEIGDEISESYQIRDENAGISIIRLLELVYRCCTNKSEEKPKKNERKRCV